MSFDVNTIIFVGFLIANLVLGLASSRGIKTIKEYAIGDRNFSTPTIVATIVATWISGEFFYSNIYETYNLGLHAIWISLGDFFFLLIIGVFFIPRMGEFLGKLSIAEAMGGLYGERVRILTAVTGFLGSAGLIAIQLKLAGFIFEWALGLPSFYGVISATIVVTLYSALGGIKSVTFTDVIQFLTFCIVVPLIAYILLSSLDDGRIVINTLTNNERFDYKQAFDFSQPLPLKQLCLFLLFMFPGFNPPLFQRVAMSSSVKQASHSFIISSIVCLFFLAIINWIAILTLSINQSLNTSDVLKYVVFNSSYVGLKGIILAGIMAMIMSTVDSFINSTAVLVVHDFCKPLKISFIKNELFSARIVSMIIGVTSLVFSLHAGDSLQELLVITESFYTPFVVPPFIMAILGFRSTEKSVLIGMLAGFITVILWDYVLHIKFANSALFGMMANFITLIGSHYLLKQSGGWVGIKDNSYLINIRNERKLKIKRFLQNLRSLNFIDICDRNCPKSEGLISILGLFVMISAFASTHTLLKDYQMQYQYLIKVLYPVTLCGSALLMSYPVWLQRWKEIKLIGIVWNLNMFLILICYGFLMVLISQFAEIQLMVFMVNILMISALISWRLALSAIIIGVLFTELFYQQIVIHNLESNILPVQFKIIYLLLLIVCTLVLFLKPKQDQQELTEESNLFLSDKVEDQKRELVQLSELKNEFLRNLEHEAHTPITGITSMGQILDESYDKLTEKQKRLAIRDIAQSSERLTSLVNNLVDISKLESLSYTLKKSKVNLSNLVHKRLETCQKLYLKDKKYLNFDVKIDDNIMAECDPYYIARTIDNIIINAIQYSKQGTISVNLSVNKSDEVVFSVKDEGIGIPNEEVYDVFGAFVVSSKTKTPAGGRGVGLALCKKVIEHHHGKIWAERDLEKGAMITFVMPALPSKNTQALEQSLNNTSQN